MYTTNRFNYRRFKVFAHRSEIFVAGVLNLTAGLKLKSVAFPAPEAAVTARGCG